MHLFNQHRNRVPVWFMRQAGRYHHHYQGIRQKHEFMEMCKSPELARDITLGPIDDFNFDAAILFSDLLFPLEQFGMGLTYNPAPTLKFTLNSMDDLKKLKVQTPSTQFYDFQKQALALIKKELNPEKTLLGFVGAPFTLYTYAVEGAHSGNLLESKLGLYDGRFKCFMEILIPNLLEQMKLQVDGGADAICLFDTAAGELCLKDYQQFVVPEINFLTGALKKQYPHIKIIYYAKLTHQSYMHALEDDHIDVLGVDWRHDLADLLKTFGRNYYIQGNFDPCWLHLPWEVLEKNLEGLFHQVQDKNAPLNKWICGLGHGVLPQTPQENVKRAVQLIQQTFNY